MEADDPVSALEESHLMGENPGGVAEFFVVDLESETARVMPRNRLLTLDELNELGYHTEDQKGRMS